MRGRFDGQPATLGSTTAQLIVWCKNPDCSFRLEHGHSYQVTFMPDEIAAFADKYGRDVTLINFTKRLRCRICGSGGVDSVLSGYTPPGDRGQTQK